MFENWTLSDELYLNLWTKKTIKGKIKKQNNQGKLIQQEVLTLKVNPLSTDICWQGTKDRFAHSRLEDQGVALMTL